MTDREAIQVFAAWRYRDTRNYWALQKKTESHVRLWDAIDIATDALEEREERDKGCDFCRGMDSMSGVFGGESDRGGYRAGSFTGGSRDFDFCPMCGRKLKGANNG